MKLSGPTEIVEGVQIPRTVLLNELHVVVASSVSERLDDTGPGRMDVAPKRRLSSLEELSEFVRFDGIPPSYCQLLRSQYG